MSATVAPRKRNPYTVTIREERMITPAELRQAIPKKFLILSVKMDGLKGTLSPAGPGGWTLRAHESGALLDLGTHPDFAGLAASGRTRVVVSGTLDMDTTRKHPAITVSTITETTWPFRLLPANRRPFLVACAALGLVLLTGSFRPKRVDDALPAAG